MPTRPKRPAKRLLARLATEAAAIDLTTFTLRIPIHILLGQALATAHLVETYRDPQIDPDTHVIVRPGLELFGDARLPAATTDEILALRELVESAHTCYVLAVTLPRENPARAAHVLDELSAGLHWLCAETPLAHKHAKLTAITPCGDDPRTANALAKLLADHLDLAVELHDDLEELGAFDPLLVDEARRLVHVLRSRAATHRICTEAHALVQQRNRYAALLIRRINHVRAAARYVFRNHDDIVHEVTGAYRHRRATVMPSVVELAAVA